MLIFYCCFCLNKNKIYGGLSVVKKFLAFIILCCAFLNICAVINENTTFTEWRDTCFEQLPEFDHSMTSEEVLDPPVVGFGELQRVVSGALEEISLQYYQSESWVGGDFPNIDLPVPPFMQKVIVEPEKTIYIQGDIHGSLHSLLRNLDRLKDKGYLNDDFSLNDINLFFLGDYGDRGRYSVEVLYTIARLKDLNSENVFFVRGNHEYLGMANEYGFSDELAQKYGEFGERFVEEELGEFFSLLPHGIFVGSGTNDETNYVFLCHGMPTFGYNVRPLLELDNHKRGVYYSTIDFDKKVFEEQINTFSEDIKADLLWAYEGRGQSSEQGNEFNWGDISSIIEFRSMRGSLAFPKFIIVELLKLYSFSDSHNYVRALFRGHQHGESGNGCFDSYSSCAEGDSVRLSFGHCKEQGVERPLKENSIFTLISAPEGFGFGGERQDYDSFVLLKTAKLFDDWKITPFEYAVPASIDKVRGRHVSKRGGRYHWGIKLGGKRERDVEPEQARTEQAWTVQSWPDFGLSDSPAVFKRAKE